MLLLMQVVAPGVFLVLLKPSLQPRASVECARLRHQGHAAVWDAFHNLGVISIQVFGRLPNAPDQLVRNKPGDLPNGLPDGRPLEELEIFWLVEQRFQHLLRRLLPQHHCLAWKPDCTIITKASVIQPCLHGLWKYCGAAGPASAAAGHCGRCTRLSCCGGSSARSWLPCPPRPWPLQGFRLCSAWGHPWPCVQWGRLWRISSTLQRGVASTHNELHALHGRRPSPAVVASAAI